MSLIFLYWEAEHRNEAIADGIHRFLTEREGIICTTPFCSQVSLLAKLPCRAQTAVLHALKYADYDPGELIIREGVSFLSLCCYF